MSQEEAELYLLEAMKKLEEATEKVIKTSGYTSEAKKLRLLTELIKEQIKHENSMHTAGTIR